MASKENELRNLYDASLFRAYYLKSGITKEDRYDYVQNKQFNWCCRNVVQRLLYELVPGTT